MKDTQRRTNPQTSFCVDVDIKKCFPVIGQTPRHGVATHFSAFVYMLQSASTGTSPRVVSAAKLTVAKALEVCENDNTTYVGDRQDY